MANMKHMTDYHTEFDPKAYLETFYKIKKSDESHQGFLKERLRAFHEFWSQYQRSSTGCVRYLEYGGGPSIDNLIAAAPRVDHIVFSEYTEAGREAVKSWLAGGPEAHDWSSVVEFVVRHLEGDHDAHAVKNREEELKGKIKSVVHCDLTSNPIVQLEAADVDKPFDIVSTCLCIEACVTSEEQYKNSVFKLCELVKPGGYLCMYGVLNATFYSFGSKKFRAFPLTQKTIEDATDEAGIRDTLFKLISPDLKPENSSAQSMYFLCGKMSEKTR